MWDYNKSSNICVIRVPEEEKRVGLKRSFKEIRAENFPDLTKNINLHIQAEQTLKNPRQDTS